jgi:hypothetical protein
MCMMLAGMTYIQGRLVQASRGKGLGLRSLIEAFMRTVLRPQLLIGGVMALTCMSISFHYLYAHHAPTCMQILSRA